MAFGFQTARRVAFGAGAYVATGTTVTVDVPKGALAISRVRQDNKLGYADRLRARFAAEKEAAKQKGSKDGRNTP